MSIYAYRIGNQTRESFNLRSSIAPGPGGYNIERAYEVYVGRRSPRHYIATKFKFSINDAEKTPGPGAYNNLLSFTNQERGVTIATKLKIGNIINFDEKSKIPGPAAYETEKSTGALGPVRPKFSFPREARNSESKMSNFPDPTSYTPKLLK